jgi:protease-4
MLRIFHSGALLALMLALIPAGRAFSNEPAKTESAKAELNYALIELKGAYPESAQLPGLFGELSESLGDALGRIDKAAADAKIDGLILQFDGPSLGWSKVRAFRAAIGRVQAAGKKVHACLDGADNLDYLVAAACDEVVMSEQGVLMTVGVRAEVTFYKNLLDLLGVKAEMLRVGEYKSAGEPYSRTSMSPEFRKEMEEILDDYYQQLVGLVAQSRRLNRESVMAAFDASPLTATAAKELGLIDRVGYLDDLERSLTPPGKTLKIQRKYGRKKMDADFSGLAGMMKLMELLMGVEQPKRKSTNPKLAVIHAEGMIMPGKSQSDFLTGSAIMGSETMVKAIQEARLDPTVKAIVLRVDSPGGSALASDLIWHELERVEQPFVVSMGDVAGSGGYYIAMGADRIFADPGTITGSIGVVGMKLAVGGLFNKVGVTTDVITRGKNTGINSMTAAYTESERAAMQKLLDEVYAQFTRKAAQGRKMNVADLEKLARGRVYTGSAALKLGLVDELGSLDDAIAWARQAAGVKPEEKLERLTLPKPTSPLEQLFGPLDPNARLRGSPGVEAARALLRQLSPETERHWGALGLLGLMSRERVLAVMPFHLSVR